MNTAEDRGQRRVTRGAPRAAKRRRMEAMDKKEEPRRTAYRDLLRVTREVLGWGRAAALLLRAGAEPGDKASRLATDLEGFVGLGERVMNQTQRLVFAKEKGPSTEKVVSIFEPHTDIIKDKREVRTQPRRFVGARPPHPPVGVRHAHPHTSCGPRPHRIPDA